jgi:hypothetical protein
MASLDLKCFPQVWIADTEYSQAAGDQPVVHCLVARELWSERFLRLWSDDLARLRHPPFPVGPGSLFVSYNAVAEFLSFLALGWKLPCRTVDLLVEFRWLTNGTDWREAEQSRHKLIHAAEYFDLSLLDAAEKSEMQALAVRGGPFSSEECRELLAYCERDVATTTELLRRMAPYLSLQALQRGRFTRTAARMLHAGIPLDVGTLARLQEYREEVIQALIDAVNPTFSIFQGTELKRERMEDLVQRHKLPWPRLDSGCLSLAKRDRGRMAERFPFLRPMHECLNTLTLLRDNSLTVGRDGRNRYGFFPFAAETGRNAWKAGEFIFAQPSYLRGLIQPSPGRGFAYLDYGQQEFAVAAVLSGDERMLEAYRADDPYLMFGKQAGLIPLDATKASHATERKRLKICMLGLQYLISPWGLANQLDIQVDYAQALVAAHKRVYQRFWRWTEAVIDRAILDGFQETLLGWRITIRDGPVIRKGKPSRLFNPRAAVNFPVQGGSADITRLACNLASERGIAVLANIHDALLVEGDAEVIEDLADEVEGLMVRAGRELLGDVVLKVDRKIIRHPDRLLTDEPECKQWAWLIDQLREIEHRRCCQRATSVVAVQQRG